MRSVDEIYKDALKQILKDGIDVNPRGTITREILGYQSRIQVDDCVIRNKTRNLNYGFSVAEWLWIMFGRDDVNFISKFNKNICNYSDDGIVFSGAYGPKVKDQIKYVYEELSNDPQSRRAVITTWRENPKQSKDIPCTVGLHFVIRKNRLNCFSWMRSNDAWLGMPYDIFNFSQLTNLIAGMLGVDRGELIYNSNSLHLYNNSFTSANLVTNDITMDKTRSKINRITSLSYKDYLNCCELFKLLCENLDSYEIDHNLIDSFPAGIKEHVLFIIKYLKKDGSHKNCSFWKEIYEKR